MMNGDVTGVNGTVDTGFHFELIDVADVAQVTADTELLDWYETETHYVAECIMSNSAVPGGDFYAESLKLYYTANDADVADVSHIMTSTAPASSSFAMTVGADKGIEVLASDGSLTTTVTYKMMIKK